MLSVNFALLKSTKMKKVLSFLLVAGLVACGTADKKAPGVPSDPNANTTAKVDSANLTTLQWIDSIDTDLGKVKEGQVIEVTYRFKNTGTKPLVISNVSASCGCTVPEKPEKPFAPGEEGTIKAKFDSKGRPHGEARKTVYVAANTNPASYQLSFKVDVTD